MTRNRLFNELYAFLMTLMVFVAATLLIQKGLWIHLSPWIGLIYCSPCLLVAYPVGRILHGRRPILSLIAGILLSVAVSMIPIKLIWEPNIFIVIGSLLIIPGTFMVFLIPFVNGAFIAGPSRFIVGLIIQLAAVITGGENSEIYKPALNIIAIMYLVFGIFTINRENLRDATKYGTTSTGKRAYPPGMRRNNILMISAIIIISLIIANIKAVKGFVVGAVKFIILKIFEILYFILKILAGGGGPAGDSTGGGFEGFMGAEAREPNPIIEIIVRVVIVLVLIAAVVFVIFALYNAIKKLFRNLPGWLDALLSRLRSDENTNYIDETEDLLGKGGLRKELSKNISDFWNRLTYRPAKFEDMPDNRAKVRFVFKQLLKRLSLGKSYLLSNTPNELVSEANFVLKEDTEEFIQTYNRARYSDSDVSDSDAELAKTILRRI